MPPEMDVILVKRSVADNAFKFASGLITVLVRTVESFPTGKDIDAATAHGKEEDAEISMTVCGRFDHNGIVEEEIREFDVVLSGPQADRMVSVYREFARFVSVKNNRSKQAADYEIGLDGGFKMCTYFDDSGNRIDELIFANDYGKTSFHPKTIDDLTAFFDTIGP
jgi:hypothetical protein